MFDEFLNMDESPIDPAHTMEQQMEQQRLKQRYADESPISYRVALNLDSLKQFWIFKFFDKYGTYLKYIVLMFLAYISIRIGLMVINQESAASIIGYVGTIIKTIFQIIVSVISFIIFILFVYPFTAVPIWSFMTSYAVFLSIFGRTHDVFTVGWISGRGVKMIMYPLFYDTAGRPYIGVQATFFHRILFGNPRYPFHDSLVPYVQNGNLEIYSVGDGRQMDITYKGSLIFIKTNPNDDVEDDFEVESHVKFLDVFHSETEGIRYFYIEPHEIIQFSLFLHFMTSNAFEIYRDAELVRQHVSHLEEQVTIQAEIIRSLSEKQPPLAEEKLFQEVNPDIETINFDPIRKSLKSINESAKRLNELMDGEESIE